MTDPVKDRDRKIMILHNFDREEYVGILKALEAIGISKKTIIAVTTPVTMEWKMSSLISELVAEDEEMKKNNQSKFLE